MLAAESTPVSEGLGQRKKSFSEPTWMNHTSAVPQPMVSPHTRDLDGNTVCVVHEVSLEEGFTLVFLFSTVSINPPMLHNLSSSNRLLEEGKRGDEWVPPNKFTSLSQGLTFVLDAAE